MTTTRQPTILLAGASRGLGLGLVQECLARHWRVIATARSPGSAHALASMAPSSDARLIILELDIARPESIAALPEALGDQRLDALFIVAGMSGAKDKTPRALMHEEIAREFITNATAPVAVAETLLPHMQKDATVAFMTSLLGSIASNAGGGVDLYRASKAALNMLAVNFAIRNKQHPVLLLHPGGVHTDVGGTNAPLDIETSCRGLVDILEKRQKPGAHYLDYQGHTLPW